MARSNTARGQPHDPALGVERRAPRSAAAVSLGTDALLLLGIGGVGTAGDLVTLIAGAVMGFDALSCIGAPAGSCSDGSAGGWMLLVGGVIAGAGLVTLVCGIVVAALQGSVDRPWRVRDGLRTQIRSWVRVDAPSTGSRAVIVIGADVPRDVALSARARPIARGAAGTLGPWSAK